MLGGMNEVNHWGMMEDLACRLCVGIVWET